jgi:thioredoxin-related protein
MSKKSIIFAFSALLLLSLSLLQAAENLAAIPSTGPTTPKGWYDDYDKAIKAAQKSKKNLYVLFTGSDWCGWCIKLKADVLDKKEFKEFAAKNLILLYIDSPSPKVEMPKELSEKNQELAKKFAVRGYPTSLILDEQGKEISKIVGAPGDFLDQLKKSAK